MSATHDRKLGEVAFADLSPMEFPMAVALQIANGVAKPSEIREATCLAIYGYLLADDSRGLVEFFNQMNAAMDMRPSAMVASLSRYNNSVGDEMLALFDTNNRLVLIDGKPAIYSVRVICWIAEWAMGADLGTLQ